MLFAIVPFKSLEAGPEFFNNMYAPHNCVGGSEQGCEPGIAEASIMFKDPSKMNRPVCELHNKVMRTICFLAFDMW
eukprot:CAMPEP_0113704178 /NCGR_PEP_ID=MMETSP0038_2-20120614/26357_1 /TAXON_ID=2898 /ORGANISM="Cryptomonas paramecium" /LENGTH=75 /DNA_ID=CAMNT_0000628895 /DNA_START=51 /DNA_END=275 /DNA_ORIENTATION=- /assembly_acc=CAM_ASM_000170